LFKFLFVCNFIKIFAASVAIFRISQHGTCADHGVFPITSFRVCEAAAYNLSLGSVSPQVTNYSGRPEGCYWLYMRHFSGALWLAVNPANDGTGSQTLRKQLCVSLPNATMNDVVVRPKNCKHTSLTNYALGCLRNSCEDFDFRVKGVAWLDTFKALAAQYRMVLSCSMLLADPIKSGKNCDTHLIKFPSLYGYTMSMENYLHQSMVHLKIGEICRMQCPCGPCSPTPTNYTCSVASHAAPLLRKAMPILLTVAWTLIR